MCSVKPSSVNPPKQRCQISLGLDLGVPSGLDPQGQRSLWGSGSPTGGGGGLEGSSNVDPAGSGATRVVSAQLLLVPFNHSWVYNESILFANLNQGSYKV